MDVRVYYENTDAAGVVYHSNFLNFFERARTEYLRERGLSVAGQAASGALFPVVRVEIDFKSPALLDDLLLISTQPVRVGGSSFTLRQQAYRRSDNRLLVDACVTLACMTPMLKPRRIPADVRLALEKELPQ